MKIIGGNVNDEAVKRISTGSAFHVGGGTTEPDHISFGTPTSSATFTDITMPHHNAVGIGAFYYNAWDYIQWGDNSVGIFWLDQNDSKDLKYVHLQFNSSSGELSSQGSEVDLGSDYSATNNYPVLYINKVSDTRCLLWVLVGVQSPWYLTPSARINLFTYDKDSDSVTKHGSVQEVIFSWNTQDAFKGWAANVLDSDHAIFMSMRDTSGVRYREGRIFKFTTTQSIGTTVNTVSEGIAAPNAELDCGIVSYDSASGKIIDDDGGKGILEWTWSGTTLTFGQQLTNYTHQNGGYGQHHGWMRHDIEAGRRIKCLVNNDFLGNHETNPRWEMYKGRSTVTTTSGLISTSFFPNRYGKNTTSRSVNYGSKRPALIDYNEDTYWERFVHAVRGPSTGLVLFPFKLNWNTPELVSPTTAETLAITDSNISGNANMLIFPTGTGMKSIFCCVVEGTSYDPARYLSVPITK